jgi:hypothetical protein
LNEAVLDSSAVIAVLRAEPSADRVTAVLQGALRPAVKLAEIVTKLCEQGMSASEARCLGRAGKCEGGMKIRAILLFSGLVFLPAVALAQEQFSNGDTYTPGDGGLPGTLSTPEGNVQVEGSPDNWTATEPDGMVDRYSPDGTLSQDDSGADDFQADQDTLDAERGEPNPDAGTIWDQPCTICGNSH